MAVIVLLFLGEILHVSFHIDEESRSRAPKDGINLSPTARAGQNFLRKPPGAASIDPHGLLCQSWKKVSSEHETRI